MKRSALILAMVCVSVLGFARNRVSETATVVADTIFYSANELAVSHAAQASYYRLLMTQGPSSQKEDVFMDFYMNGTKKAEGGYSFIDLGNDKNSVLDGDVITYYPNGMEKMHGKYVNGKRQGYFTLNMRDGSIAVVQYQDGVSKYNYFMITRPDGSQEQRPLSEIKSLLQ
jgi:hypothetical protein